MNAPVVIKPRIIIKSRINPRSARRAAGLTQSQAASLIGAALRTWQDWESGARNMPPAKWAYFCLLLERKS